MNQLTETGREQAGHLAQRLLGALAQYSSRREPILLYTSALQRTQQTAVPLVAGLRRRGWPYRLVSDAGFNEIDLGHWNNRLMTELPGQAAAMRRFRFAADALLEPPGGESFAEFLARIQCALVRLIAGAGTAPAVLVTHSTVITAVRMLALDPALADEQGALHWTGRGIGPAGCLRFEADTGRFQPLP